ncbi:hypothetical protein [Streptomyces flaveolus]|uniref:hypothetical protein n=1 Tax=Streptomyces flaveolus TaxID=67297 RepID=UPI00340ADA4F
MPDASVIDNVAKPYTTVLMVAEMLNRGVLIPPARAESLKKHISSYGRAEFIGALNNVLSAGGSANPDAVTEIFKPYIRDAFQKSGMSQDEFATQMAEHEVKAREWSKSETQRNQQYALATAGLGRGQMDYFIQGHFQALHRAARNHPVPANSHSANSNQGATQSMPPGVPTRHTTQQGGNLTRR